MTRRYGQKGFKGVERKRKADTLLSRTERLKRDREKRRRRRRKIFAGLFGIALVSCAAAAVCLGWAEGILPEPPWAGRESPIAGSGPGDRAENPLADGRGTERSSPDIRESEPPAGGSRGAEGAARPVGSSAPAAPGSGAREDGPRTVTLSFAGDVMMAGNVERIAERNGYDYPFRNVRDILLKSDLAAVNLETSVTERGTPEDKQYVYRTKPSALEAMREHGIRLVTVANNHSMDYGLEGFLDTLDHLDRIGIVRVGGGRNAEEAYRSAVVELNGIRTAFLGFSMVVPSASWKAEGDRPGVAQAYDWRQPVEAIRKAREEADLVVVLVHWGEERKEEPNERQKEMARRYIDAGAASWSAAIPMCCRGWNRTRANGWFTAWAISFLRRTKTRLRGTASS